MSEDLQRWNAALRESGRPSYLALADAIADDVSSGRLGASTRLPPLRHLAVSLNLNYTTVARAYAEAQKRGLVESRAGQGSFIRAPSSPRTVSLVEMTMNLPPEPQDAAVVARMRRGLSAVMDRGDPFDLMRYQEAGGAMEDREAGTRWLAPRLPDLPVERVLVCPGVQTALLTLLTLLVRPGDGVCTEAITYPGMKAAASQLGIRLIGVAADDEGLDPDALAHACQEHQPRAIYCNPVLLNPTTAVISQSRREAIAAIARRFAIPIIEDDAYGRLPSYAPPPIACLAPELTFYVNGLAKHVGAGLRIAYLVAPDVRQAQRLATALRATAVMASPVTARLATRWIDDGTAEAVLQAVRRESRLRQELVTAILPPGQYRTKPEAFHLWLRLPPPWYAVDFSAHLRVRGVGVVPAESFAVGGTPPEAVRVCLGGAISRAQCREALVTIAQALELGPGHGSAW